MLACSFFVPCFLLFVFYFILSYFFPASRYVYLLRVPSSVPQPSATPRKYVRTYFIPVARVLSACVICTLPHLGILAFLFAYFIIFVFFFVALISRVAFFSFCALVPGTLALDLPTLILQRRLVFLCLTVTTAAC